MDFAKPVFFRKNSLLGLFVINLMLILSACNPFDAGSDCPKLIGAAKIGGYRIEKIQSNQSNLSNFQFVDSLTGYALHNFQSIVRTTDGGKNWTPTNLPFSNFAPVHFFAKDSGVVVQRLFDQQTFAQIFLLFKTADGGQTAQIVGDSIIGSVTQIHFFDENNGWLAGQIQFFDSVSMITRSEYGLFSTKNGGKNWKFHPNEFPGFGQNPMSWVNQSTGFYTSQNGTLYRTTDGGEYWEDRFWDEFLKQFPKIQFLDGNFGYSSVVNQFGGFGSPEVFFTKDGGQSWQKVNAPENLIGALHFDETKKGLFVAKSTKCGGETATAFFTASQNGLEFDETNPLENVFQWEPIHFGDPNCFFVALNTSQLLKVTRD